MFYFGVFFLLLLNLILFSRINSFFPPIWPDEVLFYSPAYNLIFGESLATTVLSGLIEGMDHSTLWMPPIYFLYSSLFIKFISPSLVSVRLGSFLAGLLSIIPILGIGKKIGLKNNSLFLLAALLLTDLLYFKISSTARMESLCLLFCFSGIYVLLSEIPYGKKYFFSGLLIGLGVITHPFAVVYIPIYLIFLFYNNSLQISNIFWMGVGGILPLLGWSFYIFPNSDLFLLQFGAQLGRKKDLLFSVFTLITKVKIILSGFRYPIFKLLLLILTTTGMIYIYNRTSNSRDEKKIILINGFSTIVILFFLLLSSESWYVFYLIPFFCIMVAISYEFGNRFLKIISCLPLLYNFIVLFIFLSNNFIYNNIAGLQEIYFNEIYKRCHDKKKIYLQAIPDPYFYLIEKNVNFEIREFIPGELPLPEDFSKNELVSQDVYIFYNEDLIHPTLKKFFSENPNFFEKSEINIVASSKIDIRFFAVVYRKK